MSTEVIEVNQLPVVRERSSVLLMPVMDVNTAMKRLEEFQAFCAHYLQESQDGGNDGGDYGIIPGTKKKTLLKSGADKLCEVYGLYDEYVVISSIEDWDKGLFDYTLKCVLKSRRDDSTVGAGVGSCSSWESKYRWREAKRKCPSCQKENIRKSNKPGEGWYCWRKTDGCGATFKEGDKVIEGQTSGRVENEDIADAKNTVLKMAKKRAKIDATIGDTRSSGIFTQDMDDIPMPPPTPPPPAVTSQPTTFKSAVSNSGQVAEELFKGAQSVTEAAVESTVVGAEVMPPSAPSAAVDYITAGQAKNIHIEFRKEVKKYAPNESLKADDHFYQFLTDQGILDGQGQPSAGAIPAAKWFHIKQAALEYARNL